MGAWAPIFFVEEINRCKGFDGEFRLAVRFGLSLSALDDVLSEIQNRPDVRSIATADAVTAKQ